jgi:hypothetical protein
MTQEDFEALDIFLGNNGKAIISKRVANKNKISRMRRTLKEEEILRLITWYIDNKCKELGTNEFNIDLDDKSKYLLKIITDTDNDNTTENK